VTPPSVLVDATFLEALTNPASASGAVARETYASLIDAYERHELRLRSRADHLQPFSADRRTLFAPIETMSVARQYVRAAEDVRRSLGVGGDAAITLVMMKRERIRRIATFDPVFAEFADVEVVGSETTGIAPTTARRSTDA
jgi:predicted nucleic acid-binding protein